MHGHAGNFVKTDIEPDQLIDLGQVKLSPPEDSTEALHSTLESLHLRQPPSGSSPVSIIYLTI